MQLKARYSLTLAGVLWLAMPAGLKADIVTADNLPTGSFTSSTQGDFVIEYSFGNGPGLVVNLSSGVNGWAGNSPDNGLGTVYEIHRVDNAAFSLISFQGANLDNATPSDHPIAVGDTSGFGNVQLFTATSSTLTTYSLSGFSDVTAIYFSVINYSADNANLVADNFVLGAAVAVPEPSTFVAGGLGALIVSGWALLRRKSSAIAVAG
jgi:hypothetical protein